MLVPLPLAPGPAAAAARGMHAHRGAGPAGSASASDRLLSSAAVLAVHSGAMLVVMGAIALAVYEVVGVSFLRRAWINLDLLWAAALVLAGALTILLPVL